VLPSRQLFVVLHRYIGLVMAGFLLLAGITGSMLAFYDEIDVALNPDLLLAQPPHADAIAMDPLQLRERVEAHYPSARADFIELALVPGRARLFRLKGETEAATAALPNDEILINPYTGEILGERKWGDITQGGKSLMSFVFRFHRTLALGKSGEFFMGVIALLWTLNCIFGMLLTFPPARRTREPATAAMFGPRRNWFARWTPSWKVRFDGTARIINFDLHRAGGLWPWALLFVFAWAGVAFNLKQVYNPIMQSLFTIQDGQNIPTLPQPLRAPAVDWNEARNIGRVLMALEAANQDFAIQQEYRLLYDPMRGVYRYIVRSDRDVRDVGGVTSIFIDATTGTRVASYIPTGAASGDTIRSWIGALHMAQVGGTPYRILVSLLGLVVAMLSVTGAVAWWLKRSARRAPRAGFAAQAQSPRSPAAGA
jgi:uncharacterized iron-regulated membrane protein